MRRSILSGLLAAVLAALAAGPAGAQSGFALKGGLVFNSSTVDDQGTGLRLSDAAGWNLGAEVVLPVGLGVGITGYSAGSPDDFDTRHGSFVVLGEANYFLRLGFIPLTPYGGVHVGLGSYALDERDDWHRPEVDFGDVGYQFGVRFQPRSIEGAFRRGWPLLAANQGRRTLRHQCEDE